MIANSDLFKKVYSGKIEGSSGDASYVFGIPRRSKDALS